MGEKRTARGRGYRTDQTRPLSAMVERLQENRWWTRETWVRAIRRALAAGELSAAEIAEEFGTTESAVLQIVSRARRAA